MEKRKRRWCSLAKAIQKPDHVTSPVFTLHKILCSLMTAGQKTSRAGCCHWPPSRPGHQQIGVSPPPRARVKSQTAPPFRKAKKKKKHVGAPLQRPPKSRITSLPTPLEIKKFCSAPLPKANQKRDDDTFAPLPPKKKNALALPPKQGQKLNQQSKQARHGEMSLTSPQKKIPIPQKILKKPNRPPKQKKKKKVLPLEDHPKAGSRHCLHLYKKNSVVLPFQKPIKSGMMTLLPPYSHQNKGKSGKGKARHGETSLTSTKKNILNFPIPPPQKN